MVAAEHGHQAVFEVYSSKFPRAVHLCNKQGWTPLTAAARYGAPSMVEVKKGGYNELRDIITMTFDAMRCNAMQVVDSLLLLLHTLIDSPSPWRRSSPSR